MNKNNPEIDLCNDALFKTIFKDERNKPMIAAVLSKITGIDEEKILNAKYVDEYIPKRQKLEKGKTCDLVLEVDSNTVIITEMNKTYYKTLFLKNTNYAFSTFCRRTHIKNKVYPTVHLVNINNFKYIKGKNLIANLLIQDKIDNIDNFNYYTHHFDIAKAAIMDYNEGAEVLIRFAKCMKAKTLMELKKHTKGDERFMFVFDDADAYVGDSARYVTYDREKLHAWEKEQFYNDGVEYGLEQGIERGIEHERKEIIKNMLDSKMTISKISSLLKIPKEEIKQLIES